LFFPRRGAIFFQGYNQDAVLRGISSGNRAAPWKSSPMTETDLVASPQATPFAVLLESAATPHQLAVYRGVLTPRELDAPDAETAALTGAAACHDMGWLRRVSVRGEDRFRWLSGMVTNTVDGLVPNAGAWNLVLNAQGRPADAIAHYKEALRLAPDNAEIRLNIVLALLNVPGGRAEAMQQLEAYLRVRPENETTRQILAMIQASPP